LVEDNRLLFDELVKYDSNKLIILQTHEVHIYTDGAAKEIRQQWLWRCDGIEMERHTKVL
jgi:hypothetical protein